MQVLEFKNPAVEEAQKALVEMLEETLQRARDGEITQAVVITADDDYNVALSAATDSYLDTVGLVSLAFKAL